MKPEGLRETYFLNITPKERRIIYKSHHGKMKKSSFVMTYGYRVILNIAMCFFSCTLNTSILFFYASNLLTDLFVLFIE